VNGEQVDARPSDALNLAVRAAAPILVEERLLDEHGLGEMTLIETIEEKAAKDGLHIPAGEWKSLSMELVLALQVLRWTSRPQQ
jgi:bifunctional DNase/RNase